MAKRTNPESANTQAKAQEQLDELYKAHQIHTLAQMLLRQLTGNAQANPAWPAATPPQAGWNAVPGAGPVNAYWYS